MALFREIVAGIAAAAGFLGFYLGFDLRPWLALALALAIYFGVRFLLSGLGPDAEVAPGVTRGARDKAVARARQHAAQLGVADPETGRQLLMADHRLVAPHALDQEDQRREPEPAALEALRGTP
ncbi:MAG: hypothetical protein AAF772_07110, partial [Acidobacteriota bacterium]